MYNPYCPECGAKNDPQSVGGICINCGLPLEVAEGAVVDTSFCSFCHQCGYKNDVSSCGGVCSKCGATLEEFKEDRFDADIPETPSPQTDAFPMDNESKSDIYKYTYRPGQEPIKVELIAPPPIPGTRPRPLRSSRENLRKADTMPPPSHTTPQDYQKSSVSSTVTNDKYDNETARRQREYDTKDYNAKDYDFKSYDRKEKKPFPILPAVIILLILSFIVYLLFAGPGMLTEHYLGNGKKEYKEGKYGAAINSFKNAAAVEKKNPELYYYLGSSNYHQKNYDEAITNLNRAKRLDKNGKLKGSVNPDLSDAYYQRALLKAENNQPVEAASDFEQAFKINPDHSEKSSGDILYQVGLSCHEKGEDQKSVMLLTKAIQTKKDPRFYLGRAVSLTSLGKTEEAIADLKKHKSLSPDIDEKTKEIYGEIAANIIKSAKNKSQNKKIDEFVSDLEKADMFFRHKNPKIEKALLNAYIDRGEYHSVRRNFTRARYDLTKAAKMDPSNAKALYLRGNVCREERNYSYALRDYREAIRLDPNGEIGRKAKEQEKTIRSMADRKSRTTSKKVTSPASSTSTSSSVPFPTSDKQQYYIYGGSSSGYVVKPHKGTLFVISGSHYLSTKKWYWGKRSGNKLTIYREYSYGRKKKYKTYKYDIKALQKLTVSSMTTGGKSSGSRRSSSSRKSSSYRSSYSTPKTTYILYTKSGDTLFLDDYYADKYLKGVRSCYGVVKLNKVDLYLGKDFRKRSFSIKGSGRVY
ncbi:MAG: tetratricopeptide repeat protein [Candidatus Eremiobacteraeota bacterium]|nr:tetratricopeptide repeat protein [Candidatus Eremiobacteraeota bacterium]